MQARSWSLVIIGVLSSTVAFPVRAQSTIDNCDAPSAAETSVGEITANMSEFLNECVTITALSNGFQLYPNFDSYYVVGPLVGGAVDGGPVASRIIGLLNRDVLGLPPVSGRWLWKVRITGRVYSCREIADEAYSRGAIAISGFCHYSYAPAIALVSGRYLEWTPVQRKMGDDARQQFGDLFPIDSSWPHLEQVSNAADEFLYALRLMDIDKMVRLHFEDEEPAVWELAEMMAAVFSDGSGFQNIADQTPPQMIILSEGAITEQAFSNEIDVRICFCTEADCEDRWPVAKMDADSDPDRPYACTRYVSGSFDGGLRYSRFISSATRLSGTIEPNRVP